MRGEDGLALLSKGESVNLDDATHATGELVYHGNHNRPAVLGCSPADINNDGRQGVAMFYADKNPPSERNR